MSLSRGAGRILAEMVYLADVLGRVYQLESNALAMPASRETPALDHRDLVLDALVAGRHG